jgi:glyoxylase-like metal-dependent hydrolase (beta-lactamase superfamily II)
MNKISVESFFHTQSSTYTYLVTDLETKISAIVDPVLDFEASSGSTRTNSADELIAFVQANKLTVEWILETHVHADHLSSAPYLKKQLGAKIAIGAEIAKVQNVFKEVFNAGDDFKTDGSQFDHLFEDNEEVELGSSTIRVMHTPGHTPACATYVVNEKAAFVGDTIFMPDMGTARCDFPGGDASTLYASIHKILELPAETQLYMCHDYAPNGREYQFVTTVAEQRRSNIHVNENIAKEDFVDMRSKRDATLAMPALILPSVQVNMRAGQMPKAESNGTVYLKLPLNLF